MTARTTAAAVALLGVVVLAVGIALDPARSARAWQWCWLWATGVGMGGLTLLFVSHAAPVGWLAGLRRPLAGLGVAVPLLAPGFLALAVPDLWTPGAGVGRVVRGAAALVVGSALALAARAWATRDDPGAVRRLQRWSGPGLAVVAVCWTTLAVDWGMGVGVAWTSHAEGVRWFAQGTLGALAVAVLVALGSERTGRLPRLPVDVYHAAGRLLLGFVMLWAYLVFCELFVPGSPTCRATPPTSTRACTGRAGCPCGG
ncbi:MAG: hypothetical protein R3F59_27630 [Myxococcota bacterium]